MEATEGTAVSTIVDVCEFSYELHLRLEEEAATIRNSLRDAGIPERRNIPREWFTDPDTY